MCRGGIERYYVEDVEWDLGVYVNGFLGFMILIWEKLGGYLRIILKVF